ncbi:MAG: methyltransferase domain-containing protein [Cyclobacteriaceae bacterium]|nr:methyltransferase domain-containing protein [Cyclobacteriaceae bacterium]
MEENNEWYNKWFNSPYYHLLYHNRDQQEAKDFINNLVSALQIEEGKKILDLACGKGRYSIYLSEMGFDVTGVDLSQKNITLAKKHEHDGLQFFVEDMRNSIKENYFDYIFNMFTSFGYFESEAENRQVIESVAKSLVPGGKFILDFLNPYRVIHNLIPFEKITINGVSFSLNRRYDDEKKTIIKTIDINDDGKEFCFHEKVRAIRRVEFMDYFERAGLKLLDTFGDYDLGKYIPEKSERMIFLVEKPK